MRRSLYHYPRHYPRRHGHHHGHHRGYHFSRPRSRHRGHRHGLVRGPFGLLLLLVAAALLAGGAMVVIMFFAVLLVLGPLLLAGATAVAIAAASARRSTTGWSTRYRHWTSVARQDHPGIPATGPTAPGTRSAPPPDWAATRARFAQLRSEYGQFECDPLAVLRLPALTDVTVPSTGRFVDAFAAAQALDTETEPSATHRAQFADAVDRACRAWRAALDAAERIRLAGIPADERATVQRTIKLLTMARDSDHDAERIAAYARARAELAKLDRRGTVQLPPAAAAALDAAARGQLPPPSATAGS